MGVQETRYILFALVPWTNRNGYLLISIYIRRRSNHGWYYRRVHLLWRGFTNVTKCGPRRVWRAAAARSPVDERALIASTCSVRRVNRVQERWDYHR